jgi:hypothetical protein
MFESFIVIYISVWVIRKLFSKWDKDCYLQNHNLQPDMNALECKFRKISLNIDKWKVQN